MVGHFPLKLTTMSLATSLVVLSFTPLHPGARQEPCDSETHELLVRALALGMVYPDSLPQFVLESREVFSDSTFAGCVSDLEEEALDWPPDMQDIAAQWFRDGDVDEELSRSLGYWIGNRYLVQVYLAELAASVRAMLDDDMSVYEQTYLYSQSIDFWNTLPYGVEPDTVRDHVFEGSWLFLAGYWGREEAAVGNGDDEIPQFPWPPPRWTSRHGLRPDLVVSPSEDTLGAVFDRLVSALSRGGIDEWGTYAIGDSGFAIATRMETIEQNATPAANRWSSDAVPSREFSLVELMERLFRARPGHYRIIVFTVTSRAVTAGGGEVTDSTARDWVQYGPTHLPNAMRDIVVRSAYCNALIYEFRRPDEDQPASFVDAGESELLASEHLVGAGIFTESELRIGRQ